MKNISNCLKFKLIIIFIISAFSFAPVFARQSGSELQAYQLGEEAVKLVDKGAFEESLELFDKAISLDSVSIVYPYEKSLSLFKLGKVDKAIRILDSLKKHPQLNEEVFQLLGNCFEMMKNKDSAVKAYKDGIERFPNSGKLYMELGNLELSSGKMKDAVRYWESGILHQPDYPMNYYFLANHFFQSTEKVWAFDYGELFLNIETGGKRRKEAARLLYDTYTDVIKCRKSGLDVELTEVRLVTSDSSLAKQPYQLAYQSALRLALQANPPVNCDSITIAELHRIRRSFLKLWLENGLDKKFSSILTDRLKNLDSAGFLEAYNYMVFKDINPAEHDRWASANRKTCGKFLSWLKSNKLQINFDNLYIRTRF